MFDSNKDGIKECILDIFEKKRISELPLNSVLVKGNKAFWKVNKNEGKSEIFTINGDRFRLD